MPRLALRNFTTLVQNQAAAVQASASGLVDFSKGSILRAVAESIAGLVLWLQALIQYVLTLTRASTSTGEDLDSWVNDFGLSRLGSEHATGQVTFSRFTPSTQAVIPVGALVQTADGKRFTVVLSAEHPSYNAQAGGYLLPAAVTSVAVPVQAVVPGTSANVLAGTVVQIVSPITYVDTVTNIAPFTNGSDPETDAQLRVRFVLFLASLAKATKGAIAFAVTSLQLGVQFSIIENQQYDGSYSPGYFTIIIDDGSGAPPQAVLDNAFVAIDAVRAAGVRFGVFAPTILTGNVTMILDIAQGYDETVVTGVVAEALSVYINTLPLGTSLRFHRLAQVAFDASPGVTNISGVSLNGGTADLVATGKNAVKPGTISVTHT